MAADNAPKLPEGKYQMARWDQLFDEARQKEDEENTWMRSILSSTIQAVPDKIRASRGIPVFIPFLFPTQTTPSATITPTTQSASSTSPPPINWRVIDKAFRNLCTKQGLKLCQVMWYDPTAAPTGWLIGKDPDLGHGERSLQDIVDAQKEWAELE